MALLMLAVAMSLAARLWADDSLAMLARTICALAFVGSLIAFAAALAHRTRGSDAPWHGRDRGRPELTC